MFANTSRWNILKKKRLPRAWSCATTAFTIWECGYDFPESVIVSIVLAVSRPPLQVMPKYLWFLPNHRILHNFWHHTFLHSCTSPNHSTNLVLVLQLTGTCRMLPAPRHAWIRSDDHQRIWTLQLDNALARLMSLASISSSLCLQGCVTKSPSES